MAVEPHEPETVGAEARHNRLLAVAVARQHNGQDVLRPSNSYLTGELPI